MRWSGALWLSFWLLIPNLSYAGWDNGNAGDAFVSEFILTARDVVQRLDLLEHNEVAKEEVDCLRAAIKTTEVVSEEDLFLRGYERDAINHYPEKSLIRVSRARWRQYRRPTETKSRIRIVMHEYLWICGKKDDNYEHSDRLFSFLGLKNYSPDIWWNPVNPANFVAASIETAPKTCTFEPAKLDLRNKSETVMMQSQGDCGEFNRRVEIEKTAGITPPSSNVRGHFHKYEIRVYDHSGRIGSFGFEPAWGACLLPDEGSCQASGKMSVGGVSFVFWFLRE
ncbi:MAG: hypothetical protein AB7G93_06245 [Bdellovibrionales bacterium]